jgi:glycosyltransferase involved in cell wall biosynthesis
MRIALISSSIYPVPPPNYGGLELVVWNLAEALDDLGHDVTVIAPYGSRCAEHGNIIETIPAQTDVTHDWFQAELAAYNIYKPFLGYFDVIHDHSWFGCVYLAKKDNPYLKICHTHHGMINWQSKPDYIENMNMIGCSDAQSIHISEVLKEPCKTVHHGIDLDMYPFKEEKWENYLSLNRITNSKGIDVFCDIINRCGVFGDVVGEDKFVENQDYVKNVSSMCSASDKLRYIGTVSHEKKIGMLQNAKALVALPMLDRGYLEIFGLNITEAMSCGTPVIGLKNGGLIDQIHDGVTGFLCNSIDEVEEIIKSDKVSEIDPADCRERAEQLFSRKKMAENYLSLYKSILKKEEW